MIEPRARIAQLDGLRAVAVLLVFAHHAYPDRAPGGFLGVDLFFALSGYLITTLLLREHARTGRIALAQFYARRALRLMPALTVVVLLAVLAGKVAHFGVGIRDGLAALTYTMDLFAPATHNFGGALGHTWSLAVEEQFYLLWPALILMTASRRRWLTAAVVLVVVLSIVGAAVYVRLDLWVWVYRSPVPHFAELAAGSLLALLPNSWCSWMRWQLVPLSAGVALLVGTLGLQEQSEWLYTGGFAGIGMACAALVGHLLFRPDGVSARLLATGPACWLGARSYGFYLWHFPVLTLALHWLHNVDGSALAGLAVTLIMTEVSWRYVEQPFLRWKERLRMADVAR